jgi:antitoxin ParD1/3/4
MASSADLGKRLENYVSDLIRVGRYNSRSEVLREGVRLVEEREKRLAVLDAAIERGLADADAGRVKPISEVASRLGAKYERMAEDAGK